MRPKLLHVAIGAAFLAASGSPAAAATLCVQPGGGSSCFSSIDAAIAAASPGDTIDVAPGAYAEMVVIDRSLSLVGAGRENTIIDASGQGNGIDVDGFDHAGLANVSISGFTVEHADFEGIFVTNATGVNIWGNKVVDNNLALAFPSCPGLPPPDSQPGEGFDCGEGIHLSGVDHSTVTSNQVDSNAGGILLSDDSGPTHDNVVSDNEVENNQYDCGVTLASHKPFAPNGVFHNTISGNDVSRNGLLGEGAGVGLFAPIPGTGTYGNVVIDNRAIGNGIPGIAVHGHDVDQNLDDNVFIGNYIAGNGADPDAATPGTTGIVVYGVSPITGTVISQNVIEREDIAIAAETGAEVDAHLNDLRNHETGVANLGGGTVNATGNWWGCSAGPGAPGCAGTSGTGIATAPALSRPAASGTESREQ